MLKDLTTLLKIKSVPGTPAKGAPFGNAMRKTLTWFLEKAEDYGLSVHDMDGYCGWAEYGDGKDMFGILCHLDVVPAGKNAWTFPPYKLTEANGYLYGRGVVDNKGPAIIMLHVLKKLCDNGIKLKHRVRLIAGCNEETGSACLKHYAQYGEIPKFSIVPDADFPVIYSEKGILHLSVRLPVSHVFSKNISALQFGERANVIPDLAKVSLIGGSDLCRNILDATKNRELMTVLAEENFSAEVTMREGGTSVELETRGVAGHAMAPEKADNAAWKLFAVLAKHTEKLNVPEIAAVYKFFCSPQSKAQLGIDYADENSGELTLSMGAGEYIAGNGDGYLSLTLDIRLPLCADKDAVISAIQKKLGKSAKIEIIHYAPNLYIDPKSQLIQTLLKVYETAANERAAPVKTGGGTYARTLPNAAAFGPTFPGTETDIHNANERISMHQFTRLFKIYYDAVLELDKI